MNTSIQYSGEEDVSDERSDDSGEEDEQLQLLLPTPPSWFHTGEVVATSTCKSEEEFESSSSAQSQSQSKAGSRILPNSTDTKQKENISASLHSCRKKLGEERISSLNSNQDSNTDADGYSYSYPLTRVEAAALRITSESCQEQKPHTTMTTQECDIRAAAAIGVGAPFGAPSLKEQAAKVLPAAAKELVSTSLRRIYYTARLSYAVCGRRFYYQYTDMGSAGGYCVNSVVKEGTIAASYSANLPPISSLSWVDRQLVKEWRTCHAPAPSSVTNLNSSNTEDFGLDMEDEFDRARILMPPPLPKPEWRKADHCRSCRKPFGPTLLRHHCRMCGNSFCQNHSNCSHRLTHLGYDMDVPERVCDSCKRTLEDQDLAERVAWRLARCRDYLEDDLTPYFMTGLDTVEDVAYRLTRAALAITRKIPLGAQAHVAVETLEVLRKYGVKGIYTLILRKEFLAAADLLCRALGINKLAWPLSVHELSAAIFYALAQHRAIRGMDPDREHLIHSFRTRSCKFENGGIGTGSVPSTEEADYPVDWGPFVSAWTSLTSIHDDDYVEGETIVWKGGNAVIDETDVYNPMVDGVANLLTMADNAIQAEHEKIVGKKPSAATFAPDAATSEESSTPQKLPFIPVCDPVPDDLLSSLLFYAPIALNFIYCDSEVDMQLLAAQQGWRLLYAHIQQEAGSDITLADRPASAIFLHTQQKIACLAIRGTTTINDVVTDIRAMPVPFPETEETTAEEDWTPVFRGQGLAFGGMARAAVNLFRENIDCLLLLAQEGFRIRIVGHSLGGAVSALLGALVLRHIECTARLQDDITGGKSGVMFDPKALSERKGFLRVYGYGTPSCVDARLSDFSQDFCTTVVLHDDVVPRLNPTSIRGLLKHLLHIRETWVKAHLHDDIKAVADRAKGVWAPRSRGSFTLLQSSKLKGYCRKQYQKSKNKLMAIKEQVVRRSVPEGDDTEETTFPAADETEDELISLSSDEEIVVVSDSLMEVVSFDDSHPESVVVDGEQFFDSEESLLESDDESEVFVPAIKIRTEPVPTSSSSSEGKETGAWVATFPDPHTIENDVDLHCTDCSKETKADVSNCKHDSRKEAGQKAPVMLDELPLPRMFLPGKIVHLYTRRGAYHAAFVPRSFRELRRISMAGNMLVDHTSKAYYEGLLETRSVRNAEEELPSWTRFDEDDTCSCCASHFTWASTSNTEAQEARDKHNCRSCGALVCDPCSKNRIPLPSLGITAASRVCDRCYNDIDGLMTESMVLAEMSVGGEGNPDLSDGNETHSNQCKQASSKGQTRSASMKSQRQRDKRSLVVDELASRVQSSVLTCS